MLWLLHKWMSLKHVRATVKLKTCCDHKEQVAKQASPKHTLPGSSRIKQAFPLQVISLQQAFFGLYCRPVCFMLLICRQSDYKAVSQCWTRQLMIIPGTQNEVDSDFSFLMSTRCICTEITYWYWFKLCVRKSSFRLFQRLTHLHMLIAMEVNDVKIM